MIQERMLLQSETDQSSLVVCISLCTRHTLMLYPPPQQPYCSSLHHETPAPFRPDVVLTAADFVSLFYPFVPKGPQFSLSSVPSQMGFYLLVHSHAAR